MYAENGDVFLYDSAAGRRRALTQTTEIESNPRWTRDETRVTFVRGHNLFVVSLAGGGVVQVTNIVEDDEKGWAGETGRRVRYAVCDAKGPRTLQVEGLLPGTPDGKS